MFTVKKKLGTANIVWDSTKDRPLCKFVKGVFNTNDKGIAEKLKALGHTVTGKIDDPKGGKTE